ncbi:MAG: hemerythrin family protein [Bacteroidales bacterium]|nr:hemerythrin family protein [Bacteroidales bacterium]
MNETIDKLVENREKIADLIETFSLALKKKNCTPEVLDLLHRISFYSEDFFIHAELFLKKYNLASYEKHTIAHKEFVNQLIQFQERLEKGESMLAFDLYDYVTNWFSTYLTTTEKEVANYIESGKSQVD